MDLATRSSLNDLKWTHFGRGKSQSAKGTGWVEGGTNTLQERQDKLGW